jgi:hypothetical protein
VNETSPPLPTSPPTTPAIVHALRDDVLAPIVRLREAMADGDTLYAEGIAEAIELNTVRLVDVLEGRCAA